MSNWQTIWQAVIKIITFFNQNLLHIWTHEFNYHMQQNSKRVHSNKFALFH